MLLLISPFNTVPLKTENKRLTYLVRVPALRWLRAHTQIPT